MHALSSESILVVMLFRCVLTFEGIYKNPYNISMQLTRGLFTAATY